jgi:hypothetical protein
VSTAHVASVVQVLVRAVDATPVDKDVKAGWTAFAVFLLLIAAVVVLSFSFVKQLRKTEAARKAGVFGSEEMDGETGSGPAADSSSEPPHGG